MINKKYLKNLRCKAINNKNDFIFDLLGERIVDSLEIISLDFENILLLGDDGKIISKYIKNKFKKSSLTIFDYTNKKSNYENLKILQEESIDLDSWKNKKMEYNLILSNLFLSFSNNIENIINKIMNSLIPNGFFIATLPAPENFNNLKLAMMQTDIEIYGGVFNRFNKTTDLKNMINILKKINFKIPSVNLENVKLEYKEFDNLLHDVRSLNLSYYFNDKKIIFEKKNYFKILEKNYKKNYNNYFELSLNFYVISGWKDHSSQQTPMKPGEAKNKLKDFL